MKLSILFEDPVKRVNKSKLKILYHLTDVKSTIDILKNKRFKLSKSDIEGEENSMSLSHSGKSGFFTMMIGNDSLMCILDGKLAQSIFNIQEYTNEGGAKELRFLGIEASEYEVRIYGGNKNYINISNMNIFKEIRILKGKERNRGTNGYTDEQFAELSKLCETLNIPIKKVNSKQELRRKHVE